MAGGLSTLFCATSNPVAAGLHHMDPSKCYIGCGCKLEAPAAGSTEAGQGAWLWDWCTKRLKLENSAQMQRV